VTDNRLIYVNMNVMLNIVTYVIYEISFYDVENKYRNNTVLLSALPPKILSTCLTHIIFDVLLNFSES
jgi:ABC-type polysaccharide transport system permease subunit